MKREDFLKIIGGGATGLLFSGVVDTSKNLLLDKKSVKIYDNYVRGLSYYDWKKVSDKIKTKDQVNLKRDLENIHDSFAVAIHWGKYKLGYFPAYENVILANLLDNGVELKSYISQIEHKEEDQPYYRQSLAVEVFADLLVPANPIKVKELTKGRADDADDIYRKEYDY